MLTRSIAASCGALTVLAATLLSHAPETVERFYSEGLGPLISRAVTAVSSRLPISTVELVILCFALWLVVPGLIALADVAKSRRRLFNAIVCGAFRSAATAGVIVTAFYLLWGFNYSRPALQYRMGWKPIQHAPKEQRWNASEDRELVRLCRELVNITNFCYVEATGTSDMGVPSMPREPLASMDRELDQAFVRVTYDLGLHPSFAESRGPAKPILTSGIMSALGIAGFYFPYTGEANFNSQAPLCQRPHTIAHEKAHQRGITGEDEANFLGFLACVQSDDAYTRYSGYLFAQRQLLTELVLRDRETAAALLNRRLPGVQRDVDWIRTFWDEYRGAPRSVSLALNNAYLKANHVEGGLRSYRMSAQLLILFARHRGGTCLVPPGKVASSAA